MKHYIHQDRTITIKKGNVEINLSEDEMIDLTNKLSKFETIEDLKEDEEYFGREEEPDEHKEAEEANNDLIHSMGDVEYQSNL